MATSISEFIQGSPYTQMLNHIIVDLRDHGGYLFNCVMNKVDYINIRVF